MRVLWILCLTGSIICAPVEKSLGSNGAETRLALPWYTFRGTGISELGNSSDQAPGHISGGSIGYANYGVQSHPLVTQYETPVGPDGYVVGQYQAAPVQFNSASGTNDEENKPVFSDVSDLEPVYSISSRSRYQKGRAVFAQTRYIPTKSLGLSIPLFPYTSYMFAPQSNPHTVVTTIY